MPHSHGFLHHFAHNFNWAFEVEALTWAHVQLQCDGIQFFLAVYRQVCAFGQVLADQAIDVFVAAALPRAVRVGEVDPAAGGQGECRMRGHLAALVPGE